MPVYPLGMAGATPRKGDTMTTKEQIMEFRNAANVASDEFERGTSDSLYNVSRCISAMIELMEHADAQMLINRNNQ